MNAFRPSVEVRALADRLAPALGLRSRELFIDPDLTFVCERHRVAPLLQRGLALSGYDEDKGFASGLARFSQRNALQVIRQQAAAKRVAQLLLEQGIGMTEIKGTQLGLMLYGEASLRQSRDVDFLVEADKIGKAIGIVARAGYHNGRDDPLSENVASAILKFHREVEIRDPLSNIVIELHSRVLDRPPPAWDDAQMLAEGLDLNSPRYILYLILHGAGAQWNRLKWLADLAMIVRKVDGDVARATVELAKELGCIPALAASLEACATLWELDEMQAWRTAFDGSGLDRRAEAHLESFTLALNNTGTLSRQRMLARRLEIERAPPLFGEAPPARLSAIGKRAALWLLRRL